MKGEDGKIYLTQEEHNELVALCQKILGEPHGVPLTIMSKVAMALTDEPIYCNCQKDENWE